MTDWYKIKRVLIWQWWVEKQIYPAGWKPNANTIAYFPLENNSNEGSWKTVTSSDSSVSYSTLWWVKCANVSSNGGITCTTSVFDWSGSYTEQTMSFWLYQNAMPSWTSRWAFEWEKQNTYSFYFLCRSNNVYRYEWNNAWSTIDVSIPSSDIWKWVYFTLVNSSSWKYMYKNWVQIWSWTWSSRPRWSRHSSFQEANRILWTRTWPNDWESLNWWLRELIFEKKCWTAQEISAYYNQTKSKYGL